MARFLLLGLVLLAGASCGEPCVKDLPLDCAPLYTPTFDELHSRTLQVSCAVAGPGCHASEGGQAGLRFDDADFAYGLLTGELGHTPRVEPGNAACSEFIRRITSDNPNDQMPPGSPLSEAEQCVLIQWVQNGAER